MPMQKICRCGKICRNPPCKECSFKKQEGHYDNKWRVLSERYRASNPLCEDCLANDDCSPATEVHHIEPITSRPDLRLEWSNLVALCSKCHDARHGGKSWWERSD